MSAPAAAASIVRRLVPNRLRVIQRDFLTRRGGRTHQLRSSVAVDYTPAYFAAYKDDPAKCPRLIDAEAIHGDEVAFWSARRDFYRGRAKRNYYPTWDRQAQALVMLTREVTRVPQEAAFRLFTLGLKVMLLPRVVTGAELLLPSWLLSNAEGLMKEAQGEKKATSEGEAAEPKADATPSAAAAAPEGVGREEAGEGNSVK